MSCDCRQQPDECRCSLELVWDDDFNATAVTGDGRTIRLGPEEHPSPQHLLTLAASSCLMTTLLQLAEEAGVAVEAYVSSARLHCPPDGPATLALAPCIVVPSERDRTRMEQLCAMAVQTSPVLRLLSAHLTVEALVRVAPPP